MKFNKIVPAILIVLTIAALIFYMQERRSNETPDVPIQTAEQANAAWKEDADAKSKAQAGVEALTATPAPERTTEPEKIANNTEKKTDDKPIEKRPLPSPTPSPEKTAAEIRKRNVEGVFGYVHILNQLLRIDMESIEGLVALQNLSKDLDKTSNMSISLNTPVTTKETPRNACLSHEPDGQFKVTLTLVSQASLPGECIHLGKLLSVYDFDMPKDIQANLRRVLFTVGSNIRLDEENPNAKNILDFFRIQKAPK